jgi:hypothetical protein
MTTTRYLVISIVGVVLSVAPLVCAQDVKPAEARPDLQRPPAIQELPLQPQRLLGLSLQADSVAAPSIDARDLSRYREFQFGMTLAAIAKEADLKTSEARAVYQRPAVIQELEWRPLGFFGSAAQEDAVQEVLFSFYNGELFRLLVRYDNYRTEGLSDQDMIEGISAKYGTATRPDAKIILFSSFQVYNDSANVIARWEDSQYSFNLFRSAYQPTFGMLAFSKRLDALAQAAIVEAIRLDEQGAPQREIERQRKQDAANRAEQEKARLVNKVAFRP